jgi:5'-methylthioadenosine phosphorylase
VAFAHPFCGVLSGLAHESASAAGASVHRGGTYVCMEGPQFSTLAESNLYRSWGFDIIGMTNLQEAKLAREAEICYTTLALVTDYDCWHPEHDSVTVDMIIANLTQNAKMAQQVIANAVERLPVERTCECSRALAHAILTRPDAVPEPVKRDLQPLIGKYFQ